VARRWRAHHPGRVPVFCLDAGYCPITATVQVTCVNPPEAWRTPLCGFGPPGLGHESLVLDG